MDAFIFVLMLATQTGDMVTTCHALKHGAVELNPVIQQSCAKGIGIKASVITASMFFPPKWRRWTHITLAASGGFAVTWNLTVGK